MSNYLIQKTMGITSYTPYPISYTPIPQSQLILVIQKVLHYFLTCVSGHRAKERAGSTVKLWSSRKVMVVILSLLTNHFSHFGTYLDIISADEELFVMVVASSVVDILDPIPALIGVRLTQPIRKSRIRIDVIMKDAVGMKKYYEGHSLKSCRDANCVLTSASPVTTKLASWHFSAFIHWTIRDNRVVKCILWTVFLLEPWFVVHGSERVTTHALLHPQLWK